MQDVHPVAYASMALTPTETNYAQIENELFSVVFWVDRFEGYVYDRKVYIDTDHKPLYHDERSLGSTKGIGTA